MAVSMLRCEEDTIRRDLRQEERNPLSFSLFGKDPDLTSKYSQDMIQQWRLRSDKAERRRTCAMSQIQARTSGQGGATSVSIYSQDKVMDVSNHMVVLDAGRL